MIRPFLLTIAFTSLFAPGAAIAQEQAGMSLDICPNNFNGFPMDSPALTCGCSAEQAKADDTIWGANPYSTTSSLCRAAVHAGTIGLEGGSIMVKPEPDIRYFPTLTRNGIESASKAEDNAFTVETSGGKTPAGPFELTASGLALDICPNNLINYPAEGPPLSCDCSTEQAKADDTIWGANPYSTTSSLCRAGVHAGVLGLEGGKIVVTPQGEAAVFPSVTRNGVESASKGKDDGFTVAAGEGAAKSAAADNGAAAKTPLAGAMMLDICPNNYNNFPMDSPPLVCGCSAEQAKADDTIWGTNPYATTSSLCRSAVHAGVLTLAGGQVVVTPEPDVPVFPSVTRNGVESASTSADNGFRVAMVPGAEPPKKAALAAGKPVQAPIAETLKATGTVQLYVNFATDQAVPLPSSMPVLMELLAALNNDPSLKLELIGHTDNEGGAGYNLDLSKRRSQGIEVFLVKSGIDAGRLKSSGRGLAEPIADNASSDGRALNRRVEARQID
jgi:outer membrane protein OmpA-like peptidoglycan-associated protein